MLARLRTVLLPRPRKELEAEIRGLILMVNMSLDLAEALLSACDATPDRRAAIQGKILEVRRALASVPR
jgi:hypothetical protein